MHQTTCQTARETGIHQSSVCSVIYQDLQLKCLKRCGVRRNSLRQLCSLVRLAARVIQGRVGAHKLGVMKNIIYVLLQISSGMLLPKIMKIDLRIKSYCKNKKGIVFKHSVEFELTPYCC